ncbi:MAG: hypothetical protein RIR70_2263 [Pseudomonadota bacterium]|jgi:flagellar biosynthesis/type III secretory pathway protein FliH
MATVINIGDWVIASAHKVWTPEELACAQEAVGLLEEAAGRAREIIAQAERDGQRIRETAQNEGYRVGEVQALRRVLGRLGGQDVLMKAVRAFVTEAVSGCAQNLLAGDLDPARYRRLLETVERTLSGWTWITLRVSPESYEEAGVAVAAIQSGITDRVKLIADEGLKPGECLIESDAGWLDGRIETQLQQVRAAVADLLDAAENASRES